MATLSPLIGVNDQWDVTLTVSPNRVLAGNVARLDGDPLQSNVSNGPTIPYENFTYVFSSPDPRLQAELDALRGNRRIVSLTIPHLPEGTYEVSVAVTETPPEGVNPIVPHVSRPQDHSSDSFFVTPRQVQAAVTLQRTGTFSTDDQALWVAIRNRTSALDFTRYQRFINILFCADDSGRLSAVT